METRLRELLRDRADEAEIEPTIPASVVRRARARRRRNVAVTGLLSVAVVAGSIIGIRAALDIEPPRRPAATDWRGIWPQNTRPDAERAQAAALEQIEGLPEDCVPGERVDPGGSQQFECPPAPWQLLPDEVATRYAEQVLGWPQAYPIRRISGLAPEPITFELWNTGEFDRTPIKLRATVTVERLLRPDPDGLWFVTAADQVITPAVAERLVFQFVNARIDGYPVDGFLSSAARKVYDQGEAGLSLYGGPRGLFISYEIVSGDPAGEDTFLFLVRMSRTHRTVAESLLVGPGVDANGDPRPVVVLSVSRVEFQEIEETTPATDGP